MKRRLSRAISLSLIAAMLFSLAGATVSAKNSHSVGTTAGSLVPAAEVLFSENFNSITSGTSIVANNEVGDASYNKLYVAGADGNVQVVGDGTDNYLAISATTTVAKAGITLREKTGKVFTGKFVTEFKFMLTDDNEETYLDLFVNKGGIGAEKTERMGSRIMYMGNNKLYPYNGTVGGYVADNKILQGSWYNVKIISDIPNKQWTLYVNGAPIFINKSMYNIGEADNMLTPFICAGVKGTVYYDDIVMYREPVGRVTYSAEDFAGYGADRDWATFENTAFVGANYMPSAYSATAVDLYDTWIQGMNLAPAKVFTNGKISNGRMQLGGTGNQSVVLLDGYNDNHSISQDMAVSFTFNTTNANTNHDEIYRMRESNAVTGGIRLQLNQRNLIADSNPSAIIKSGIEDNRDYRITVVSDFSSKTYSVYVDGECLASGFAHKASTSGTYNNNGRPLEITMAATAPTCYYDDIVIYADVREDVMMAAMATAKTSAEAVKTGVASFALPASAISGYTVAWSSDNAVIAVDNGTATVTYPEEAQKVTLTATVADTNGEYAIERKFVVSVPSKYDTEVSAEDGVVTGTVTVNDLTGEGYNGGKAILAIYDSSDRLVNVKYIGATDGTATVTSDKITEAGNYTAKLFFLNLSNVKPFTKRIQPYTFEVK